MTDYQFLIYNWSDGHLRIVEWIFMEHFKFCSLINKTVPNNSSLYLVNVCQSRYFILIQFGRQCNVLIKASELWAVKSHYCFFFT